jgi:hypothetical protein
MESQMKKLLGLACGIAFALPVAAESPIDGKWESRFTNPRGAQTLVVFDLKSDGENVIGSMTSRSGSQQSEPITIQDGRLRGNSLTFSTVYTLPFLQQRFITGRQIMDWITHFGVQTNAITGAMKDDTISFTQHDWTGQHLEFEAKKAK